MKGFSEGGSGLSLKDRSYGVSLNRDDRVHGSLLIMIELFMNCILKAEVHIQVTLIYKVILSNFDFLTTHMHRMLYSGKRWWCKTLLNLANWSCFAKVLPSKFLHKPKAVKRLHVIFKLCVLKMACILKCCKPVSSQSSLS